MAANGTVDTMTLDDPNTAKHGAASTAVMTIGTLARRTGVPVKTLREYEDLGFIYTVGRSAGNYRLFGEEALWCVGVVTMLRGLGLTLSEIRELTATYLMRRDKPIGPRLAQILTAVRSRSELRIAELQALLQRITDYEADHADELSGRTDFRTYDPRSGERGP
jgi:DNA-binding transcriptional MerR regulator